MKRLLLITEIIAPYRIPVFNELARTSGVDMLVVFLAETDCSFRAWHVYKNEINFNYVVLPSWRIRVGSRMLLLGRGLSHQLRRFAPDVIICGGYNYPASWQALFWAKRRRVPFVLWCESNRDDLRDEFFPMEMAKRAFISRCSGFVVPGQASREFVREFVVNTSSIHIAPNAVDVDLFESSAKVARFDAQALRCQLKLPERYLLFVGRLVAEKGIFDVVNAFASLKAEIRRGLSVVFVGRGGDEVALKELALKVLPGRVQFAGFVQREELPAYYALAEALVLPTHSDPWGLVVNEAMACGLPVIVSDVAGCARDLVRNGWNGYVVKRGDVSGLASAIQKVIGVPGLLTEFGAHSAERIQAFSPRLCAAGLAAAAGIAAESAEAGLETLGEATSV